MKHYTKEELELYRHGQLSVLGRIACSSHLKECESCAKRLEEVEHDDAFVRELRDSIKTYKEAADGGKPLKQEQGD